MNFVVMSCLLQKPRFTCPRLPFRKGIDEGKMLETRVDPIKGTEVLTLRVFAYQINC